MPHHRSHGTLPDEEDEAPSPRPSVAAGCYTFLLRGPASRRGYRRLDDSASAAAPVRVEVGTAKAKARSVFHVDPAVLEAGPVRRLLAAAGRRIPGGAVAVAVDAMLFEHLLWLATATDKGQLVDGDGSGDDLSEIVEFYSQEEDDDDHACHGFKC